MRIIKIKYFDENLPTLKKIKIGNWIDLRTVSEIQLKAGEYAEVNLGIGMILPKNYEAWIVPRSSTFKKWKIIQVDSPAIIDTSFSGDCDQWHYAIYATEDVTIEKYSRICQFRIIKSMNKIHWKGVLRLKKNNRGALGTTGHY